MRAWIYSLAASAAVLVAIPLVAVVRQWWITRRRIRAFDAAMTARERRQLAEGFREEGWR